MVTGTRLGQLLETIAGIGSDLELESVLQRIAEAAVRLVDARYGAVGVVGGAGRLAEFIPVGLDEDQITAIGHWPEGKGLLGELISSPQPLRTPDIGTHPRSSGFPPGHPPMRTFLGAPMRIGDASYGNLYLADKRGGEPFNEDDEALVVALAAAAGVAVDKALLYAEARRQRRWLQALAEVTKRLLSDAGTAEILSLITDLTLEIADADLAVLALPAGGDGRNLIIEHASGRAAQEVIGLVLPAGASVSGWSWTAARRCP